MKHCGKSTQGRALAAHYGCAFYDTDELVAEAFHRRTGIARGVRQICHDLGEEAFRRAEVETVEELHARLRGVAASHVVAVGGGLLFNDGVYPWLQRLGRIVYLRVPPARLLERILRQGRPAFLRAADPEAHFLQLYADREPLFQCYADVIVDLDDRDAAAATRELVRRLEEPCHAGK
jgi:shikimate kinase